MPLLIGQVARKAGVGIGAVRLYERMGLIPRPLRTPSGYRQYPEDTVLRVRVIHSAKPLGFTLREMADLFAHLGPAGLSGAEKDAVLDEKLREVAAKIRSLEHVRALLLRLKLASGRPTARAECALAEAALSIVEALESKSDPRRTRRATTRSRRHGR
jgi:MerR family mercuric resistance operon transcriptional regulator